MKESAERVRLRAVEGSAPAPERSVAALRQAEVAAELTPDPPWPAATTRRIVFLLDASSGLERRLLTEWIERHRPADVGLEAVEMVPIPPSRRRRRRREPDPRLAASLTTYEDPLLVPIRIAWRPAGRRGAHAVGLRDLLTFGDPRDPDLLRQHWILRRHPERCWVVVGEPAPVSELRARWRSACGKDLSETVGLPEFVVRQATLALDRAERRVRGLRYKVPRFVHEDILRRPAFLGGVAELARKLGKSEAGARREAEKCLREIAANHNPYVIDIVARLIHLLYTQGYSETLQYDRDELEEIYALAQKYPVVFLPSHKSNLDHLVLQYMLHQNGHPPNHTAAGINMNFFPVGPLIRQSGSFFIRRSFKDDEIYKFVLHQYIDYLVEKRFSLEWYIEGGRSRSGKLLPPRFGMLSYVVDAYRRGKAEDVVLIPTSIAYDQIQDVGDYVHEQTGGKKRAESFGWFVGVIRRFRRPYGTIHMRFGEPVFLSGFVGQQDPDAPPNLDEQSLAIQKLAFEVAVRINQATPITPISLVATALLGTGEKALTLEEVVRALRNIVSYVRNRKLPTTVELDLDDAEGVRKSLDILVDSGVVSCFSEGPEPVYVIEPGQYLTAAYYRNSIAHFFLRGSIAELALLRAAEDDACDRMKEFWEEVYRLRDLLKFEFFFAERDAFREEVVEELRIHEPAWEEHVAGGPSEIRALVRTFRPLNSHRILRPFFEAYLLVAETLERWDGETEIDESAFLGRCLGLGHQYQLQKRIRSPESVSRVLCETGLRLAKNRKLTEPGTDRLDERRREFAEEIRGVVRRVEAIDHLAASRRAGLID